MDHCTKGTYACSSGAEINNVIIEVGIMQGEGYGLKTHMINSSAYDKGAFKGKSLIKLLAP